MKEKQVIKTKSISKRLDNINNRMKALYQDTYKTRVDNSRNMEDIINSIDDDIDSIMNKVNSRSSYDIANLCLRLQKKNGNSVEQINKSIEEIFNNDTLLNFVDVEYASRSIQAEDYQYDLLCKYIPDLEKALDIKKDCVLSSDNFTKEFINVISDRTGKDFIQQFNDRAILIKNKYAFQELCEEIYDDCSHYGEYFLYCVPYKKALERLLNRKSRYGNNLSSGIQSYRYEQTIIESGKILLDEDYGCSKSFVEQIDDSFGVKLEFNHTGLLINAIDEVELRNRIKNSTESLTEEYILENTGGSKRVSNSSGLIAPDGFVEKDSKKDRIKDIPGAVSYKIPRDEIFPICINDKTVLGYLNLEIKNDLLTGTVSEGGTFNSITSSRGNKLSEELFDQQTDLFIGQLAAQISEKIDAQFINANIDLANEIYSILRYNDRFCVTHGMNNINITFIPADDVIHFYFKKDNKTHRGISDLKRGVKTGMIYCLLYLSDTIAQVTRSYDKRLYYVKQNVETNVSRTLQNVLVQIKRGNMGMRQLQNMNTMFNMVGRFNDHLIPIGPSDDPPIRFEVMEGQDVKTPVELMDRTKEETIETTDVPIEYVQTSMQVDYATRFSMTSSKFLRIILKRQSISQSQYSTLFTRLYNYEFNENESLISIMLPVPAFLAASNNQQLIENVRNYVQAIADFTIDSTDDELKNEFIKIEMKRILGTYINFENIEQEITEAKHAIEHKKIASSNDSDSDYSDSEY